MTTVLLDVGYSRMTMDDVAVAAGVGKAAIYRRWPTKEALLADYVGRLVGPELGTEDTGSLRTDLLALLTGLANMYSAPVGRASRRLLGSLLDDPALAEVSRRGPLMRYRHAITEVFRRAGERGELDVGTVSTLVAESGPAILLHRWLINPDSCTHDIARAVVDDVMLPLLQGSPPGATTMPSVLATDGRSCGETAAGV